MDRIDEWRAKQRPIPTRPEAIRRFVEIGLYGEPHLEEMRQRLVELEMQDPRDPEVRSALANIRFALGRIE